MQKLIIPTEVKLWQVIIKIPEPECVAEDGVAISGAEVIITQIPGDNNSIILEKTGEIDTVTPGKTITYTFKNH